MGVTISTLLQPTGIYAGGLFVDVKLDGEPWNGAIFGILLAITVSIAATEVLQIHVPYSKFAHDDAIKELPINCLQKVFSSKLEARFGYFLFYAIPLLSYVIIWGAYAGQNKNFFGLVAPSSTYSIVAFIGWVLSFSKRCLEVLFVHIYSGSMPVLSSVLVIIAYSAAGLACAVFSNQVVGYEAFGPTTIVKDVLCVIFFFIGYIVNAIAHYQLRLVRLRSDKQETKKYFAPEEIGILFKWFICPHYLFETIMFVAWSAFGATCVHWMTACTIVVYLSLRTRATYQWYKKKGLLGGPSSSKSITVVDDAV